MRTVAVLIAVLVVGSAVAARQEIVGNGVTAPRVVKSVQPRYTAEAIRARIEGVVVLGAVVQQDGAVGEITVVRSLDSTNGLDEQAIAALKQWKFEPGTKQGKPVAVRVHVELEFNLRSHDDAKQ
jgi:periplasmic protein TonB